MQDDDTSKGCSFLGSCLSLWIRDSHRIVCASMAFCSHDVCVDNLHYMDLFDILEWNAYDEENVWIKKIFSLTLAQTVHPKS